MLLAPSVAVAGPPYITDDPEPVELHHWEVYLATQDFWAGRDGWSGTSPQVEVNYGVMPDVQLHVVAPLAWAHAPGGGTRLGYGDTELGAKVRFVHEGATTPQIGTFPLIEVPTGDSSRGLGMGQVQVFLPVWIQKSFGAWTTYGGGGYWVNAGPGPHEGWYLGWLVQRQVTKALSVGAEVFHAMSSEGAQPGGTRFDVGMLLDLGEHHHLMASAGRAFDAQAAQLYFAWLMTFGPGE